MSDRLEKIYGSNLFGTEIKPDELPNSIIFDGDKEQVDKMRSKTLRKLISELIIVPLGIVMCIVLLVFGDSNTSSMTALIFCILIIIVTLVGCLIFLVSLIKRMKVFLNYNNERLEYGIVSTKFIKKVHTSNSNTVDKYYAHVGFQENQTYIRNVIIVNSKDYEAINEGDKVIVASFDGAVAYVINI